MKDAKKNVKTIPPIRLNLAATASKKNTIPKYIGFLEYLKAPVTTKDDALSIAIGLMVVFCSLNDKTADAKVIIPSIKNIRLTILNIVLLKSGNRGPEKYIANHRSTMHLGVTGVNVNKLSRTALISKKLFIRRRFRIYYRDSHAGFYYYKPRQSRIRN